jgi:hypothetical protein
MTIIESIRNYFLTCQLLGDGRINVDYLGDVPTEYNIDSVPTNPIVQRFSDGGSKRQFTFVFSSREYWGQDTLQNMENNGFYEELSDWLETNGTLPIMEDGKKAEKVECLTYGYLMGNSADNAQYQIQLRLIYIQDYRR